MRDVLTCLLNEPPDLWGLQISVKSGRPTGTVYPILERLEREGLVQSRWEEGNDRPGPRRRLYVLTTQGRSWASTRKESRMFSRGHRKPPVETMVMA